MAREPILSVASRGISGVPASQVGFSNRVFTQMEREINVLALVKGGEKYIFLFDDENRDETLRQLARFAANPDLDFSWYDAAMLSRKIRDAVPTDEDVLASQEFDGLTIDDFH